MYLTWEQFLELTAYEVQVYLYFRYKMKSALELPPLSKSTVAKDLKMSRPSLDKALKRLETLGIISILPHPKRQLVIRFPSPFDETDDGEGHENTAMPVSQ